MTLFQFVNTLPQREGAPFGTAIMQGKFSYLSENQLNYSVVDSLRLYLSFDRMVVCSCIDSPRITLEKADGTYLSILHVVMVDCSPSVLGTVVVVTCAGGPTHTIIADW